MNAATSNSDGATAVPDDGALALRVAQGDRAAAGELVQRYEGMVRRFLRRLTRRDDLADDLAQETFLRLLRYAGQYDARYPMRTWLFTIARRLWINAGLKKKPVPMSEDGQWAAAGAGPALEAESKDQRRHWRECLHAAMETLPENQRVALVLFHEEGLSVMEVAKVMELPPGTVKSHLHRGRASLRTLLTPLMQELPQ